MAAPKRRNEGANVLAMFRRVSEFRFCAHNYFGVICCVQMCVGKRARWRRNERLAACVIALLMRFPETARADDGALPTVSNQEATHVAPPEPIELDGAKVQEDPPAGEAAPVLTREPLLRREAFDGSVPLGGEAWRTKLPPLTLPTNYARFNAVDGIITGIAFSTTIAMAIAKPIEANRRTGGILFDEDVRSTLRAGSVQGRYLARDTSDVMLSVLGTYPFFVDTLGFAFWYRGNAAVAREMGFANAQALAIMGMIQGLTNVAVARERPYGRDCSADSTSVDCTGSGRYRSFFSGHAAFSFTAASLSCSHHLNFSLLGSRAADIAHCGLGYALAAATATLRVVGDMHYATDVMVGAGVGTAVGLLVPWLRFRLGGRAHEQTTGARVHVTPLPTGLGLGGAF
jgi:membrane-associated phospholipid phosphatase